MAKIVNVYGVGTARHWNGALPSKTNPAIIGRFHSQRNMHKK
jgi:hypothetical protein